MNKRLIKVAIVEDNIDIRESLEELIDSEPGLMCSGTYGSAEQAIKEIPLNQPDVVLMDINLPGMQGMEAVFKLKEVFPAIHFLMCTEFYDDEKIFQSLRAGASGYILKNCPTKSIVAAINEVYEGGAPMSAPIAMRVISSFHTLTQKLTPSHPLLTSREMEILELLAQGFLGKEVADKLNLSTQTVRNHCGKIYHKLHVNTKLEALNIVFGNKYLA